MGIKTAITECTCDFCKKQIDTGDYCYRLNGFQPDPTKGAGQAIMLLFQPVRFDGMIICDECLKKMHPDCQKHDENAIYFNNSGNSTDNIVSAKE